MKVKIEKFKKSDINSIVELEMELADFHRKIDDYYKPGNEKEIYLKRLLLKSLGKKNINVLVVKDKREIIGFGVAAIEKPRPYCAPKKIGYLKGVYIKENYRRKRIGEKIFHQFLDWFKSRHIKNIELSVDSRNKIGLGAWRKYGFFEYQKRMRNDL